MRYRIREREEEIINVSAPVAKDPHADQTGRG